MLVAGSFACASLCFIHSQLHVCSTFAIWQHPDPAQNLTKSCRPSQLSTHKISSKSVHNFFRYPAKIQKSGVSCFLDPDYDPDPAQNLINSSRSPQLLTRKILSKFVHNLLRYTAKIPKSGSWIQSMIRITLKSYSVRPRPDICWHTKFHPNPSTCFWVILLTDRQTNATNRITSSFVGGNNNGFV